ncbi:RNase III inhibitor [Clostridia bacterium]|nr:RNase III inhibitor [Clostridia bacterium]
MLRIMEVHMKFEIVFGDITKIGTEAVVNAANNQLKQGAGVCGAIFKAVGAIDLQNECNRIGYCKTGEAVLTSGYALCKYVIHTVGSIWKDGSDSEKALLKNCYTNSLLLAKQYNVKSIAFPLISAGIYGFPENEAEAVAVEAINEFQTGNRDSDMTVYLVKFNEANLLFPKMQTMPLKKRSLPLLSLMLGKSLKNK